MLGKLNLSMSVMMFRYPDFRIRAISSPSIMLPAIMSKLSAILLPVAGLPQILMTGETTEPTTLAAA
jgi:hypothetical protein